MILFYVAYFKATWKNQYDLYASNFFMCSSVFKQ